MRPRFRTLLLATAVGALLPVAAPALVHADATPPTSSTTTSSTVPDGQPKQPPSTPSASQLAADGTPTAQSLNTYSTLDSGLAQQFPDQYAGMEIGANGDQVVHFVGGDQASVDSAIASLLAQQPSGQVLPTSDVQVVSASAPIATLNGMQATLTSGASQLEAEGVKLESWGVDIPNNTFDVTVINLTKAGTADIEQMIGSTNVDIESTSNPGILLFSRKSDTFPWYGGDVISIGNSFCTSGFHFRRGA